MEIELDPEIAKAFCDEIIEIRNQLKPYIDQMRTDYSQAKPFEQFGLTIDRIYGTAATIGFKEVADYARALKWVSYKCSQSSNMYAKGQVKDMCMVAVALLEKFVTIIQKPNEVKKIQYTMQKEREKADEVTKKFLHDIKNILPE